MNKWILGDWLCYSGGLLNLAIYCRWGSNFNLWLAVFGISAAFIPANWKRR